MKIQNRISIVITLLLFSAVLTASTVITWQSNKVFAQEQQAAAMRATALIGSFVEFTEQIPETVENAMGEQMLGHALTASRFVALAEKAGYTPTQITQMLKEVTQKSTVQEFWVTDPQGHAYIHTAPGIDFTFSPDPKKQPQASAFYDLLTGKKEKVVQRATKREVDDKVFKYVGVKGTDKPRIVQVGSTLEVLQQLDEQVGLPRLVNSLVVTGSINMTRVIDKNVKTLSYASYIPNAPPPSPTGNRPGNLRNRQDQNNSTPPLTNTEVNYVNLCLQSQKEGDFIENNLHKFVVPLKSEAKGAYGVVLVGVKQDLIVQASRNAIQTSVVIALMVLLVGFLLSSNLTRRITSPLVHLTEAIAAVGTQKYKEDSLKEVATRTDEIGQLATTFVEMEKQIRQRETSFAELNQSLEARVTERTQELQSAREASEEANIAKSRFLANMSHELRTPLNAIIGYSEMLLEEAEDTQQDDFAPDLKKINTAGKHLLELINAVLDLSKIEAGKMELYLETFSVSEMLKGVQSIIKPLVEKNGNVFVVRGVNEAGDMFADATKLRQVLLNLLSNACKFTENGTITLEVTRRTKEDREWIRFRVIDTGLGMTPEQVEKVFGEFTQADTSTTRKYGGTGLGLAISRRFCNIMGGDILIESEFHKGSTFTVTLPVQVTEPEQTKSLTSFEQPDVPKLSTETNFSTLLPTILVIDDEPSTRELMARMLGKEGYRVETAASGREGLEKARSMKPGIITLDVVMPGMDGWQVLSELKADPELYPIPVIMVSMIDDQNMGYALGAADFLTKPVERDTLLKLLTRYRLNRESLVQIVEDDPASREMMERLLEKEGFQTRSAENGRVALEQITVTPPQLILLDLNMPEVDGFMFVELLHVNPDWRNIPIIVVSARDLSGEEREHLQGHVERILRKGTYRQEDLLRQIGQLALRSLQEKEEATE